MLTFDNSLTFARGVEPAADIAPISITRRMVSSGRSANGVKSHSHLKPV